MTVIALSGCELYSLDRSSLMALAASFPGSLEALVTVYPPPDPPTDPQHLTMDLLKVRPDPLMTDE